MRPLGRPMRRRPCEIRSVVVHARAAGRTGVDAGACQAGDGVHQLVFGLGGDHGAQGESVGRVCVCGGNGDITRE